MRVTGSPTAEVQPPPAARFAAWPAWAIFGAMWLMLFLFAFPALGEQRFPPPEFESGHKLPVTSEPAARSDVLSWVDIAVLAGALAVSTWLVFKKRSRSGLVALSIFSLLYFGFWRNGCVCAIGSVQNIALALSGAGYRAPLVVVAFFALPLLVALFFGRTFCAGVCPHGALQDLVLARPVKVPDALASALSILPFVYLGAGILFAATGSAFIFCEYDPFIPIFRMTGRTLMVITGILLLLLAMFVGRPYCRFLCPYGALLKIAGVLSRRRVRVTPDYCTQCRLCEASCPFGAMREPGTGRPQPEWLGRDRRRLALLLVLVPILIAAGAWLGSKFGLPASKLHPDVTLAQRLVRGNEPAPKAGPMSPDALSLERARQNSDELLDAAAAIQRQFRVGGAWFGAWIGLVIGAKLISLSVYRRRTDFEPDRGDCVACARCFEFCPNELVRRGLMPASSLPPRPMETAEAQGGAPAPTR